MSSSLYLQKKCSSSENRCFIQNGNEHSCLIAKYSKTIHSIHCEVNPTLGVFFRFRPGYSWNFRDKATVTQSPIFSKNESGRFTQVSTKQSTCFIVFRGTRFFHYHDSFHCRVLKGGCSRGGGNWGTLRIPGEDWGTLGNIREPPPLGPPPLNNPIK